MPSIRTKTLVVSYTAMEKYLHLDLVPLDEEMDLLKDEEDVVLQPRPYQIDLLEHAVKQNTVLFLPTGSGKTYVAIMLIRELSHAIVKPYNEGGKRTFFMVNTVALVTQQADSLRKHTPFTVGTYSSDKNVDYWGKDIWDMELTENQILVMTSQIFLDMLSHGFVKLGSVNLLIFDECHHGVNDHPMRQIMKRFEDTPKHQQPRVLGLSATLIMGTCKLEKVPLEVQELEKTFHSKVATVNSMQVVKKFSTNPTETIVLFYEGAMCKICSKVCCLISKYQSDVAYVEWPTVIIASLPGKTPLYPKVKTGKALKNLLGDLEIHIGMLGIYGGSKATLAHIIQLERRRIRAENETSTLVHGSLISGLTMVYQILFNEMEAEASELEKIMKYSTDKVLKLLQIIIEQKSEEKYDENGEVVTPFCGVIFVQRRFTAKILYQILKSVAQADPTRYGFVKPDFIVGLNANPMNDTREGKLEQKTNDAVIWRFNRGVTNLLVSSDVLEEGIDIPKLSLVVRFDSIMNPTSYIQSKGRARHETSNFKIMVPFSEQTKFNEKFVLYKKVEMKLIGFLVGRNDERSAPSQKSISDAMSDKDYPPYYASGVAGKGACITISSAVSLLYRYCSMLPQDKFTVLQPSWFRDRGSRTETESVVYVRLPMSSPLKDLVPGRACTNERDSKRTAAMEACIRLHKLGELNERLLPKDDIIEDHIDDFILFPNWDDDELEEDVLMVGTQKMRRPHDKPFPAALSNCRPQPNGVTYLHRITLSPSYPKPVKNRRAVFYDFLNADRSFAIISSSKLPEVCKFSIFLNVGEVSVSIESNSEKITLDEQQIKLLRDFNSLVFNEVLCLEKDFIINDVRNEENAYLIAPTAHGGIDWEVVRTHKTVPKVIQPSLDVQREMRFDEGYLHSVVSPWYRCSDQIQAYVVTKVCDDLSPRSAFPMEDFRSYEEYFTSKYLVQIHHKDQPLVEVKAISSKMHCLKPRIVAESKTQSKRRRQDINEDFEEHLVPELCVRYDFPAVLWLKATCLPTVLHRLTHLLLAEELRVQIAKEVSLGVETLPPSMKWNKLTVDALCESPEKQPESLLGVTTASAVKQMKPDRLWGEEKEPVDIDRIPLEQVLLAEVRWEGGAAASKPLDVESQKNIVRCCMRPEVYELFERLHSNPGESRIQSFEKFIQMDLPPSPKKTTKVAEKIPVMKIKILNQTTNGIGPQLCEIIQALTSSTANDIMNLERCELLGDSFLKFAVSLFLYQHYAGVDEGRLTGLKGKLVGNRNLYYCGKAKGLPAKLKVNDFSPSSDFIPPSMCVPQFVRQVFNAASLSPNTLLALRIPREERMNGTISGETLNAIQEQLLDSLDDAKTNSTMETFLGYQTVKDKTVADSVEALIGTYLKSCGIRGALSLLGWLDVLPAEAATPEKLLDQRPPTAQLDSDGDVMHHLQAHRLIEAALGYTFNDKSFLLQALTHPSYEANRVTESYQRLEFLGDAVIDFLTTCHIYERSGTMTPGQLTDLRSALVNNVYFAAVVVRCGFHKHMRSASPKLHDLINKFVTLQEERNHMVNEQVLFLIEESDMKTSPSVAEAIDVPKALGDLLEALIGAVYLDSNMSLEAVWDVLYRLMHKEIDEFSRNIPKQPVRLLYERLGNNKPIFHPTAIENDLVMVKLEIVVDGIRKFYMGIGHNKGLAKTAAAKIAIKGLGMHT